MGPVRRIGAPAPPTAGCRPAGHHARAAVVPRRPAELRGARAAHERPGQHALLYRSEQTALAGLPWEVLAGQVRVLATRLRELGIRPGDRVASCLPNVPQAVIAMLATTSIGAIWSSCSPDFGWRGVIDRFSQLAPRVLFCADGYRYAGQDFPRTSQLGQIIDALGSLQHVIYLPHLEPDRLQPPVPGR